MKTMGDGFMASFSSATRALECAIAMQRAFAEQNEKAEEPIRVRIGLNAGEPIAEGVPGRSRPSFKYTPQPAHAVLTRSRFIRHWLTRSRYEYT